MKKGQMGIVKKTKPSFGEATEKMYQIAGGLMSPYPYRKDLQTGVKRMESHGEKVNKAAWNFCFCF